MGRPVESAPADRGDTERVFRAWRTRVLEMHLAVRACEPLTYEVPERAALERARRIADPERRASAIEALAVRTFGVAGVASIVGAALAGRGAWAPSGDFSVAGAFAAPREVVADRRAAFTARHTTTSDHHNRRTS